MANEATIREIMRQHMNESNERHIEVMKSLVEVKTNYGHAKEKIDTHEKSINNIKKTIWFAVGTGILSTVQSVRSALGL